MARHRKKAASAARNRLRLIGGDWRGRKLTFPDAPGLRPTPDRVRETLFNWLAPVIRGARCLDLFAGSGALGLEALSRGAAEVVLVDSQAAVIAQLRQNLDLLQAGERGRVVLADARDWLDRNEAGPPFDIVFLDPPYQRNLLQPCIDALYRQARLRSPGWLYFECNRDEALPDLPPDWQLQRQKTAGQIRYCLVRGQEQG